MMKDAKEYIFQNKTLFLNVCPVKNRSSEIYLEALSVQNDDIHRGFQYIS